MKKSDFMKLIAEEIQSYLNENPPVQARQPVRETIKQSELKMLVKEVVKHVVKEAGPQYKVVNGKSQVEQPGKVNRAREIQDDPTITEDNWIQGAVKHPGRCAHPGDAKCPEGSPQYNLAQRFKHGDIHRDNMKEGSIVGWANMLTPVQKQALDKLESKGWRAVSAFPGQPDADGGMADETVTVVLQKKSGPTRISGELDPDGSVNGQPVDQFLAQNVKENNWIKGAINPDHKGYCSPETKSTCTPARKAFAQRAKHGDLEEKAPPGFSPHGKHADIRHKLQKQYGADSPAAYATMNKIAKNIDEMGPESRVTVIDDIVRDVVQKMGKQVKNDPKVIVPVVAYTFEKDYGKPADPEAVNQAVLRMIGHGQGSMKEAGPQYKVAQKNQTQTSKVDKAKKGQEDPKVQEGHKVQHRSYNTVEDLPNNPKNVQDPEVPNT